MSSLNLPWCSFQPFPHILLLDPRQKSSDIPLPFLWSGSCKEQWGHSSASFSPNQTNPKIRSCSSQDIPSSLFISFVALVLMHLSTFMYFLGCGARNCMQYPRWGCTNPGYSGIITSLAWLVMPCLMHPGMCFALLAARTQLAHTASAFNQHPQMPFCRAVPQVSVQGQVRWDFKPDWVEGVPAHVGVLELDGF